jgi:hypothetical protein
VPWGLVAMRFLMCSAQAEAYSEGHITRMPIGLFRCAHADPNDVGNDEACDYVGLWEAPLELLGARVRRVP